MTTTELSNKRSIQGYADVMLHQIKEFGRKAIETRFFLKVLLREMGFAWLGFTLFFSAYKRWVTLEQRTKEIDEARSAARKQGLTFDHKIAERRDERADRRFKASMVLAVALLIGFLVFYFVYRDNFVELWGFQLSVFTLGVSLFAVGIICLFDAVGHKYVPPRDEEYEARPTPPLEKGMTIATIQNSIKEILWFHCKEIKITFHGHRFIGDYGVEFEVHLTDKILEEHLAILEKHMQTGRGRIKLMPNKKNTAAPILRVFWSDPLADAVTPEPREPKSLSIYDKFTGFRDELGKRVGMRLVGSHQFWTGRSGSGKSSALWVLLDFLVDCRDADVFGIDIGGTVFAPFRRQMMQVATTTEDAEEVLDAAIEECERRVALLDARMDAEEEMEDENWRCTEKKGERALFIIIDEYTKFAKNKALREKVDIIFETGRKARVHVIVSTPDATKPAMGGSTAPINHAMIKVVFGTPFAMITPILGPGSVEEGWRPDFFESAQDGNPGDSGKCFIQSAEFGLPIVQRFDRLTTEDIYARNRARRNHVSGAPTLPEPLMILKAAFELNGKPEKLPTSKILEIPAAAGWDKDSLRQALKDLGEATGQTMPAPTSVWYDGKSHRGYEWAGVEAAIKAVR